MIFGIRPFQDQQCVALQIYTLVSVADLLFHYCDPNEGLLVDEKISQYFAESEIRLEISAEILTILAKRDARAICCGKCGAALDNLFLVLFNVRA